jgi:hypothetical protein
MFGFADEHNRGELLPSEFAEAWEYLKLDINKVSSFDRSKLQWSLLQR